MLKRFRALAMGVVAMAATLVPVALAMNVPRPLPDITITTITGQRMRLQQYKGKVMAVVLFSTQCADCLRTIKMLDDAQKKFNPAVFQAVGAAVNIDAPQEIKGFADRYRPALPIGQLDHVDFMKLADLKPSDRPFVPLLIFIDKHSVIRVQYEGTDPVMKSAQEKGSMAIIDSLIKAQ